MYSNTDLYKIALKARENAYAPYSNFKVGAVVLSEHDKLFGGCNVENASYPAGICAERNAIFHAVACGEKEITAIAIVGGLNGQITDYCPPCGVCRQVMREFCDPEHMTVIIAKSADEYKEMTLAELLPESFGPDSIV